MSEIEEVKTTNLAPEPNPQGVIDVASSAAEALMSVAKPVTIGGKQYLTVEDWQTIGTIYGVVAGSDRATYIEEGGITGYEAHAVVRKASDGMIVSEAIGRCMREGIWTDREAFALASMAQTRAISKALRGCLAWVVRLKGYQTTPAEEITEEMRRDDSVPQGPYSDLSNGEISVSDDSDWEATRKTVAFSTGKNANKTWSELDNGVLKWAAEHHKSKGGFAGREIEYRKDNEVAEVVESNDLPF